MSREVVTDTVVAAVDQLVVSNHEGRDSQPAGDERRRPGTPLPRPKRKPRRPKSDRGLPPDEELAKGDARGELGQPAAQRRFLLGSRGDDRLPDLGLFASDSKSSASELRCSLTLVSVCATSQAFFRKSGSSGPPAMSLSAAASARSLGSATSVLIRPGLDFDINLTPR
jgi:hypothetical protein